MQLISIIYNMDVKVHTKQSVKAHIDEVSD